MKALGTYLLERVGRTAESEVDDELRFHLEMLEQDCRRQGMAPESARAGCRERFGDLERARRQCLQITRRKDPFTRTLKSALVGLFVAGVVLRLFGTAPQFDRLADLSIAIGILGHLFLLLRERLPADLQSPSTSSASTFSKSSDR